MTVNVSAMASPPGSSCPSAVAKPRGRAGSIGGPFSPARGPGHAAGRRPGRWSSGAGSGCGSTGSRAPRLGRSWAAANGVEADEASDVSRSIVVWRRLMDRARTDRLVLAAIGLAQGVVYWLAYRYW